MPDTPKYHEDSLDSKLTELLTLQRLDAEDRAEFRAEIKGSLKGLTERADYTNSKIATAIREIEEIKKVRDQNKGDLDDIVATKRFIEKFLFNKYALIGFAIFTIGAVRVLMNEELRLFFWKLLGF